MAPRVEGSGGVSPRPRSSSPDGYGLGGLQPSGGGLSVGAFVKQHRLVWFLLTPLHQVWSPMFH